MDRVLGWTGSSLRFVLQMYGSESSVWRVVNVSGLPGLEKIK